MGFAVYNGLPEAVGSMPQACESRRSRMANMGLQRADGSAQSKAMTPYIHQAASKARKQPESALDYRCLLLVSVAAWWLILRAFLWAVER
jgi:hypothetical protein